MPHDAGVTARQAWGLGRIMQVHDSMDQVDGGIDDYDICVVKLQRRGGRAEQRNLNGKRETVRGECVLCWK